MRLSHQQGPGSYEGPVPSEVRARRASGRGRARCLPSGGAAAPARGGEPTSNGVVAPAKPSSFLDRAGLARASSVGWSRLSRPGSGGTGSSRYSSACGSSLTGWTPPKPSGSRPLPPPTTLACRCVRSRGHPFEPGASPPTPAHARSAVGPRLVARPSGSGAAPRRDRVAPARVPRLAGPPVPRWARCREPAREHRSGDRGRADRSPAGAPGVAPDRTGTSRTWPPGARWEPAARPSPVASAWWICSHPRRLNSLEERRQRRQRLGLDL